MKDLNLAKLLIISVFIPAEFYFEVGGLKIEVYRVILATGTLYFGHKFLLNFHLSRVNDVLMLVIATLGVVSLLVNHGLVGGTEKGGIFFLESMGAYLIARFCIRSEQDFVKTFTLFAWLIAFFCVFAFIECTTGRRLIHEIAYWLTGHNVLPDGVRYITPDYMRAGFVRAAGPFSHPILNGTISAMVVPVMLAVYLLTRRFRYLVLFGLAIFSTVSSLSSAPLLVLLLNLMMLGYFFVKRVMKHAVKYLVYALLLALTFVQLFSNRGVIKLIIQNMTFNPHTGTHRLLIVEHLSDDIMLSPFLGSGIGAFWSAPGWMGQSIDNYWLAIAFFHGIPFSLLLLGLTIYTIYRIPLSVVPGREYYVYFSVKVILVSLMMSGFTVHFFDKLSFLFYFLLGVGAWFANARHPTVYNDRLQQAARNAPVNAPSDILTPRNPRW